MGTQHIISVPVLLILDGEVSCYLRSWRHHDRKKGGKARLASLKNVTSLPS